MAQRRKKTTEFHFVNMNDPDRYKKLKVARACDFCRKRKTKCDVGIPGSGTCSNCKKSSNICVFSAVNPDKEINSLVNEPISPFLSFYQSELPLLSVDRKGHCEYEKDISAVYVHVTLAGGTSLPFYSKQFETDIFNCYFEYVHPLYPVLNKYEVLQDIRHDKMTLGVAFKSAVMALALLFGEEHDRSLAASFYQYVLNSLEVYDEKPYLEQIQTLLLLYKYQEVITPVGTPLSSVAISHLRDALRLIDQFNRESINQWTIVDEFVCRAHWILYMNLTFSNSADSRINSIAKCCAPPARWPCLTEMEQYNKVELGTTCNLVYLVNITTLFSEVFALIEDPVPISSKHARFRDLTARLDAWKKSLPEHILVFLTGNAIQQIYNTNDGNSSSSPNEQPYSNNNSPTSFITFLCLVYTLLRLMIVNFGPMPVPHDLSEITLSLCYNAHALTEIGKSNYSFLASIQGSRLVSYSLTLSLQLYQYTKYNPKDIQPHNLYPKNDQRLNDCCTLITAVFDQLSISPQLFMAVQNFKSRLGLVSRKSPANGSASLNYSIYNNNNNSSASNSSSDSSNRHYSSFYLPPMNSDVSSESMRSYSLETNTQQQHHYHQEQYSESQPWNQYSSNNQCSGSNHNSLAWEMMAEEERPQEDFFQMPLTPTFDIPSNPLIVSQSHHQHHQQQNIAVSLLPFDSIPSELYYRESCRFKNMSI
ncbi:hypothetical protein K501DRAFT_231565 [Backusella circina FSU 941]|nr:hypothetical protein K501DRAFT_231565 [Backusella circina FSU 941]